MKKLLIIMTVMLLVFTGCSPKVADQGVSEEPMQIEESESMEDKAVDEVDDKMDESETMDAVEGNSKEITLGVEDRELIQNEPAPDFTLETINDEIVSLSDYKGQYVIVSFWATWCTYCRQEMPHLDALDREEEDFKVLAVNQNESKSKAKTYMNEEGFQLETLLDKTGVVGQKYQVQGLPTNYFFDKEGNVLYVHPGMLTEENIKEYVDYIRENH